MLLRNLKFLILVVVFLTFTNTPILARIIHVPGDSSTVQGGINGAVDGDTVLVARGHYYERINFYGKAILVTSNYICDDDTTTIDSTIIDADTSILGVSDTASGVVFVSEEDSTSIIKGFTIQNGFGTVEDIPYHRYGGGIYCNLSSPTISHNIISNNAGVAIWCRSSSPTITHNRISENSSHDAGGISCFQSSPVISQNIITENHSAVGGAISCYFDCSPTISNNRIEKNYADFGAGIFCFYGATPTVINNTITTNSGDAVLCNNASPLIINNTFNGNYGSGISCFHESYPTIVNNIISNNVEGKGIFCAGGADPTVLYNNVFSNTEGNFVDCPAGVGDTSLGNNINGIPCDSFYNIIRDPLFVDSLNDFHLQEGSPCIDAGDNSATGDSDLDGNPRIVDGNKDGSAVVDMGAFEYQPSVGIADGYVPLLVGDFTLAQNYPNPFNPETNIQYYIPEPTRVKLVIYNVLGQKVTVLVNEFQTAGRKYVTWDGKDQRGRMVASGMYLYKLETSDLFYSKKMLLLK